MALLMALQYLYYHKTFVDGVVAFDMEGIQHWIFAVLQRKDQVACR